MLSQIKNLLKGGKKERRLSKTMTTSKEEEKQLEPQESNNTTDSKRTLIVADPNKLPVQPSLTAQQIFEKERLRKRRLPSYAGLERFEIMEKLGE